MEENLSQEEQLMDILLVMDKETKSVRAVKGIDENGELETVPATKENQGKFMKFDSKKNLFQNFFSNFMRQLKDPTRFHFFQVGIDKFDKLADKLKQVVEKYKVSPGESATETPEAKSQQYGFIAMDGEKPLIQIYPLKDTGLDNKLVNDLINVLKEDVPDNPGRNLSFYKVPEEKQAALTNLLEELSIDSTPSKIQKIRDAMEHYKLNTENMEKNVKEENPQSQSQEIKANSYRFDESKINWDMLKDFGLSKEKLQENKVLDSMLKGNKSPGMYPVSINLGDVVLQTDARLSFRHDKEGGVVLAVHGIKQEPELDKPFFGYRFSEDDKENLLKTGNMGRLAETKDFRTGEMIPSYVSIDKLTNEVIAMKAQYLKIPDEIKGVKLDEGQKQILREGKPLQLDGMTSKNGKEFSATLQVNAERRGIEFIFENNQKQEKKQEQEQEQKESVPQEQKQDDKKIFIKNEIGGQKMTKDDKETLLSGGTIFKEGLIDKKGELYNAYIKVNPETNKLKFYKDNPNQAQVVAPGNEYRQQVAANNEGKKSEANKHVDEPFKKGQNAPTEKQQEKKDQKQEQQIPKKSKGVKM